MGDIDHLCRSISLIVPILLSLCVASMATFELTLLHTNDVHARFEEFNKHGTFCTPKEASQEGKCFGGVARRATMLKQIRAEKTNTLFIDGGDQFQGTLWFYYHKGKAAAYFMQLLEYDAMALGNHEFDLEVFGLIPFLDNVTFPVLSCNIDASSEPDINRKFSKSTVLTVGGERIGLVGYTWEETPSVSKTGDLVFSDEVPAIQIEVDKLVADGVNKIIAVGHAGIENDLKIAKEVRNLDIVVGGHTDTFLYTGDPPSTEKPYGPYPIVVTPDGDPQGQCLVVQDYTFGKYLGYLEVIFDDNGKVKRFSGNPILLDDSIAQDPEILEKVKEWARPVNETFARQIGESYVTLDGGRTTCRAHECNLGNLVTDAMLAEQVTYMGDDGWTDVSIALMNSGGIRSSIGHGPVTVGDVNTALPFGNTNNVVQIKGKYLVEALEHSVKEYSLVTLPGSFFQVSGMKIIYNLKKEPGHRVASVEVLCTACEIPDYEPLDKEKVYSVVMQSFLSGGGDGFTMISDNIIKLVSGNLDSTAMANYIEQHSPVYPRIEGRITFVDDEDSCLDGGAIQERTTYLLLLILVVLSTILVPFSTM